MQWTVRLEARTSEGEVKTTELVTFNRPGVVSTLAEIGLMLAETKTLLAKLQASMLCGQVAAYAAHHRVCAACGVLQPLKDRRTRRLQTVFGTVEVEAPQFKVCRCRLTTPLAEVTVSPVCALLTARCTPELERVQAELGARTSFRDGARILEALLPVSPANHESLRTPIGVKLALDPARVGTILGRCKTQHLSRRINLKSCCGGFPPLSILTAWPDKPRRSSASVRSTAALTCCAWRWRAALVACR